MRTLDRKRKMPVLGCKVRKIIARERERERRREN